MNTKKELQFKMHIDALPTHVYRGFASSQGVQEWLADEAEADGRPGGRFYGWWNAGFYAAGFFKEAVQDEKLVFSWWSPLEPKATTVEVLFEAENGGTALTLTHSGLEEGEEWAPIASNFEREWNNSLANLKSVMETGVDKRLFDRPMLGFFIGGLVNNSLVERFGLPIDYGMHVAGLVPGLGAERSGLLADDVLASVDGVEVRTYQSLAPVLARRKGGDVVRAIVYRDSEKIELDVELSKRPVPDFPPPPAELAVLVRRVYKEALGRLKSAIKGVSEKEANFSPGEGEWSVKQTMVHLLVAERWSLWAWDHHPAGDKFPSFPGSERTVQAIAKAYKTRSLFKEIKRCMKANVNMVEQLPDAYAENKAAYFLVANNYENGIRTHFEQHVEQINAAVAAARGKNKQKA